MNKKRIALPENLTAKARSGLNITVVLLFILVLFDFYSTGNFLTLRTQTQLFAMSLSYIMTAIAFAGAWLSWNNRAEAAGWVLIAGSLAALFFSNFLGTGLGIIYALTSIVIVFALASSTLPQERIGIAVIASVLSGAAGVIVDLYFPNKAASGAVPQTFTYVMLVILMGLLIFVVSRQFRSYSLRTKLLIGGITLILISVGTLGLISYNNSRSNLTASAGSGLKSLANTQANAIANVLLQETHILQSFNLSKLIQDRVDEVNASYGSDQAFNQQQIAILDQQWRAADKTNNNNDPIVSAVLNSVESSELREFRDTFPENVEVFVTDRYGALIASTNRTSDYYQADEDWWQAAYNNGKGAIYYGQPEYDESSKTFGVVLAVPIVAHGSNQVTGVVRTTITIDPIIALLNTETLGGSGHADLYISNLQALGPESTQGLTVADPEALSRLAALTHNTTYDIFQYEGASSVVTASTVTTTDPDSQAAIQNLDWVLIVHQDEADSLAPVRAQARTSILVALSILIVGALLTVFLAQTLSGPIVRLTQTAEKIAGGDINLLAAVETGDEIGTLAGTFNQMTTQLRDFITSLEERVAARTQDLATVAEVGTATATILETDKLLQAVVDLTKERFNLYHSHIYLLDETGENLALASGAGEVGRIMVSEKRSIQLNREQSLVARAARERKGVTVNDVTQTPDFLPNLLLPNTRSELAVPMIVGGKVIGVFDIQSDQAGRFTEADVNIQTTLASQISTSLQNVRAFEQSKSQAELETLVNAIGQKIQLATSVDDTLQVAVRELGLALGAEYVNLNIQAASSAAAPLKTTPTD